MLQSQLTFHRVAGANINYKRRICNKHHKEGQKQHLVKHKARIKLEF